MLYANIALIALFAPVFAGSPARPPQIQIDAECRACQPVAFKGKPSVYLAACRLNRFDATDVSAIILFPGDEENGTASLRVKTRTSA